MSAKPLFFALCLFTGAAMAADPALKTEKEKLSYTLGLQVGGQVGGNFKQGNMDIDPEVFSRAVKDALSGAKPALSEEEMRATLQSFQQKQVAAMQQKAAKNKKDSEAFLAANKKKKGVVTLPSGLQYKVVKNGTGKKPTLNDTVIMHYTGTLINGKEFDSSVARGQPMTMRLAGVIKGFQEALQLMSEGSKWQVVIPPDLAYGEQPTGPIEPNSTLVFDIELLAVKPGDQNQK